jgi:hypothetical protein
MDSSTYRVVMNGQIVPGYETELVAEKFAGLFKLSIEKANALVGTKRTLQKGIALELAETYKKKLYGIGLGVEIEKELPEEKPEATQAPSNVGGDTSPTESVTVAHAAIAKPPQVEPAPRPNQTQLMTCPKCNTEQAKADDCASCGVIIAKVAASIGENNEQAESPVETRAVSNDESSTQLITLLIPAVVALCGALLWYGIAYAFNYELGLIAWGIGGAVGFSAATVGGKGETTGIICGVLVVLSIFGGKYMTAASYQDLFVEQISALSEDGSDELKAVYEQQLAEAKLFVETVTDDQSLREFLVNTGYSEGFESSQVSEEEIRDFKEYSESALLDMVANEPNFEQWRSAAFSTELTEFSTFDLMAADLGLLDIVFVFLGVGTAFRLGRGDA